MEAILLSSLYLDRITCPVLYSIHESSHESPHRFKRRGNELPFLDGGMGKFWKTMWNQRSCCGHFFWKCNLVYVNVSWSRVLALRHAGCETHHWLAFWIKILMYKAGMPIYYLQWEKKCHWHRTTQILYAFQILGEHRIGTKERVESMTWIAAGQNEVWISVLSIWCEFLISIDWHFWGLSQCTPPLFPFV